MASYIIMIKDHSDICEKDAKTERYGKKEERKEMFYLTTYSTRFYLRLYGVRHMVKNHSDKERERER